MKNSELLYWRKAVAQEIDNYYYEPKNAARCHKQGYELFGKYLCATTYPTYMKYLKASVPAEYRLPARMVYGIRLLILNAMKYPSVLDEKEMKIYNKLLSDDTIIY